MLPGTFADFLDSLEQDPGLKEEFAAAAAETRDRFEALARVASRHGQPCTPDDLRAALEPAELTDDELGQVCGGNLTDEVSLRLQSSMESRARIVTTLSNTLASMQGTQDNLISNLK